MWRRFDSRAESESGGFLCHIDPYFLPPGQTGVCGRVPRWYVANPLPLVPHSSVLIPGYPARPLRTGRREGTGATPPLDTLFESRAPTPGVSLPVPPGGGRSRPIYPCGKARLRPESEGGKRRGRRGRWNQDRHQAGAGSEIGPAFDRESGRRIARCEGGITS